MRRPPIDLDDDRQVLEHLTDMPVCAAADELELLVLLGDGARLSWTMAIITDVSCATPAYERAQLLGSFWRSLRQATEDEVSVSVAILRHGPLSAGGEDLAWHDLVHATTAHAGIPCVGVYLVTPRGAERIRARAA